MVARQPHVASPARIVPTSTPVVAAPKQTAPKAKAAPPAKVKVARVVKPKAAAPTVPPLPHDRNAALPAAFLPAVDSIDRDLLALAGFGLLLVALGGAVVLFAARRQLRGLPA